MPGRKRARKSYAKKEVFIVHGTDHGPMKELKAILAESGLNPIVLNEQPSGGRTLVEKLEEYSDVGYAFVILTPDDLGGIYESGKKWSRPKRLRSFLKKAYPRARQNVILELGYFIGKLGRDRVSCLLKKPLEQPSDIHGIVYIRFDKSLEEVRNAILKELEAAGYTVNPSQSSNQ
ncbi:nucleotide-binding protein [Candidatus Bathyarchaeota archaeon A05DMB-2]|nr:nucleotide-binding protein [Candidatus Bathyarchaeota archaeon A05DMB-2]